MEEIFIRKFDEECNPIPNFKLILVNKTNVEKRFIYKAKLRSAYASFDIHEACLLPSTVR